MQIPRHSAGPQHQLGALLYARNSRGGKSVEAQMIENRREAADRGWAVLGEYVDTNRSASRYAKKKREDFDALVERVQRGEGDVIVTWENSRLQRDLEVYVQIRRLCMETGVLWCYGGDVYDMSRRQDRKRTAQDAVASEDEVEVIRDRNLRTVRLNAEAMRPHGRILTGYTRRYDPATGDLIDQVADEEWAPVIRRIFTEFVARNTIRSIRNGLRADRILTSTGKEWSDAGIHAVLTCATYAGYRVYQGQIIGRGTWDGLISVEIWNETQAILNDPERPKMRDTSVVHLLSNIPTAKCGGVVTCQPANGSFSYICSADYCSAIQETVLDAYVEELLLQWLALPESAAAFQDPSQDAQVEAAIAQVALLTAELEQARAAAKAGTLSVASLIAVEAGTVPRLEAARMTVQTYSAASPLLASLLGQADVDAQWDALALAKRRAVLRETATIVLNPAKRRGDPTLYEGRIVMKLGPKAAQSSDAASASSTG